MRLSMSVIEHIEGESGQGPVLFRETLAFNYSEIFGSSLLVSDDRSRERHRRILLSTASSFLARGFSLALALLTVRIVLDGLGKDVYGVWAVITAAVIWSTLLDFGVLNGLVNAIAEAFGRQDRDATISLTATAFYSLASLAVVLAVIAGIVVPNIRWEEVLSGQGVASERDLRWSVLAAVGPLIVGIPLSVVRQVYAAYQRAYVTNIFTGLGALTSLGAVIAAGALSPSLPLLVLASTIGQPFGALLHLGYMLTVDIPWLRPQLRHVSPRSMNRLLESSVPIFLIQCGALLVNFSQPLLLAHLAGYTVVADFTLLSRLYGLVGSVVVLATAPFFPAFREAYERGERIWVRRNFTRMMAVRLVAAGALALAVVFAGNRILSLWLGADVAQFPTGVWLVFAATLVASAWGTGFSELLTIMDRLWIQVGFVLLNGVLTVMLTVVLVPSFGVLGALLAFGFTAVMLWSWLGPILSKPILAAAGR